MPLTVSGLGAVAVRQRLRSAEGLRLRTGPFVAAVRSPLADVAQGVSRLYADYTVEPETSFTDFHVAIKRPSGLRQLWKPQVSFELDGGDPFNPLPGDQGFPLLEWGLNWCVYGNCHQYLILHAAVLERNGRALILPAPSGSGKSTLCAGLLFHGWRLLSDELALICPHTGRLIANPRPVSLKNASIDVISRLVPSVQFGSRVSETIKGVVAHFAAPSDAVSRADETALPGWVVLPRYVAGSSTQLQPMERSRALLHLVENAFNYDVFGEEGFDMLASLADRSACYSFEYSRLEEAIALFTDLADRPSGAANPGIPGGEVAATRAIAPSEFV
jgi:HprK-related kinase A